MITSSMAFSKPRSGSFEALDVLENRVIPSVAHVPGDPEILAPHAICVGSTSRWGTALQYVDAEDDGSFNAASKRCFAQKWRWPVCYVLCRFGIVLFALTIL